MATKLFLRNTTQNGVTDTGDGVVYDMLTTAGAGVDSDVVNLTDGGTEIQWTQSGGGSSIAWISGRVPAGGFTLTSTDISVWLLESNMNDEAEGRFRVYKYTPGVPTITELGGGPFDDGAELGTTITEMTWIGNVTDTAFAENDRILLRLFATNFTTMTAGTATLQFNAADAATGDSFFNIAETVAFKVEAQTVSSAGAIATAEAFGTLSANFTVSGAGAIATAEAFGSAQLNLTLPIVGGIETAEAFGTLSANLTLSAVGDIASAEAFGTAVLASTGPQTVDASGEGIASAEVFGTLAAHFSLPTVGGLDTAEVFGTLSANFTVSGAGNIATAEAFGTDQFNLTLPIVGGIDTAEDFGALSGNFTVSGAGDVASAEAFGPATLSSGANQQIDNVGAIATAEAFGTLSASFTISGAGDIVSAEEFGTLALNISLIARDPFAPVASAALSPQGDAAIDVSARVTFSPQRDDPFAPT